MVGLWVGAGILEGKGAACWRCGKLASSRGGGSEVEEVGMVEGGEEGKGRAPCGGPEKVCAVVIEGV